MKYSYLTIFLIIISISNSVKLPISSPSLSNPIESNSLNNNINQTPLKDSPLLDNKANINLPNNIENNNDIIPPTYNQIIPLISSNSLNNQGQSNNRNI